MLVTAKRAGLGALGWISQQDKVTSGKRNHVSQRHEREETKQDNGMKGKRSQQDTVTSLEKQSKTKSQAGRKNDSKTKSRLWRDKAEQQSYKSEEMTGI